MKNSECRRLEGVWLLHLRQSTTFLYRRQANQASPLRRRQRHGCATIEQVWLKECESRLVAKDLVMRESVCVGGCSRKAEHHYLCSTNRARAPLEVKKVQLTNLPTCSFRAQGTIVKMTCISRSQTLRNIPQTAGAFTHGREQSIAHVFEHIVRARGRAGARPARRQTASSSCASTRRK
jgi:hypothetical protein